jgi:hypothetical protein
MSTTIVMASALCDITAATTTAVAEEEEMMMDFHW